MDQKSVQMQARDAMPARQGEIDALRRHQRRLLYGGGGLISLLIVLAALASIFSGIEDFHARERQIFEDGRQSIDEFLTQRDRSYATSLHTNNALWMQTALLKGWGVPWMNGFLEHGEAAIITAPGDAVPWLVLGNQAQARLGDRVPLYLGMIEQYSAYTKATLAGQSGRTVIAYGYEPSGALLAVTGVGDEASVLKALAVKTRAEAITRLMVSEKTLGAASRTGTADASVPVDRMAYYFGSNPFNGEPSLVTVLSLDVAGQRYFRRVTFEPMAVFKQRLEDATREAFAIVSRDGRVLVSSGDMPDDLVIPKSVAATAAQDARAPVRLRLGGTYVVASSLHGVDWMVVHPYSVWSVLQARRVQITAAALAALGILVVLWLVLLRMDRRVFAPALADAARVYESDALNRAMVQTSPVGLVLIDPAAPLPVMQNAVVQAIVGADPAALELLYQALRTQAAELHGDSLYEFHWGFERDGQARRLHVAMAPTLHRERRAWLCVLRDVTAETELQERLQQARIDSESARQAAEQASQAKSAFVATMSHEIRTPLNAVLGHLELLSRSPLEPAQKERIERIRFSADSLLDIISDVLDFSRIESGQLTVEKAPFALRPLIEQAALLYAPDAQRKGVRLYYSIDPELEPSYLSDAHRLRQILNNLLGNAVKFTESGRIVLKVSLAVTHDVPSLRFEVVDSGIGMTGEQLAQLFQPFTQADAGIARRYGGSGLGLALCRQLSQLLGGEIHAQSTQGVGSAFVLELPAQPVTTTSPPAQPLKYCAVDVLSAAIEWRQEMGQMLTLCGADVSVAASPAQLPADANGRVLLIAGDQRTWSADEEAQAVGRYARLVAATANGPLVPEQRADRTLVSCYLSEAIVQAVTGRGMASRSTGMETPGPVASRGRVLLVEDHPVNRELIQQQLETIGFEVDVAEDGVAALSAWNSSVHDAVLTDINMPGMNGYQLARSLRERGGQMPIFAITATALSDEGARCEEAGMTALLLKPLSLERLDAALTTHLGSARVVANSAPSPPVFPEKVRRAFVQTGVEDLRRLHEAALAGDTATLRSVVHAFKGVLLMLKEQPAAALCAAVESQLSDDETGVATEHLSRLSSALHEVVERYRRSLET